MTKKIIFLLFFSFLMCLNTSAEEFTMPTDKEIMSVIEQYNIPESQKELLFKETKRQLQESSAKDEFNQIKSQFLNLDGIQENNKSTTQRK